MNERLDDAISLCMQTIAWVVVVFLIAAVLLGPFIGLALLVSELP